MSNVIEFNKKSKSVNFETECDGNKKYINMFQHYAKDDSYSSLLAALSMVNIVAIETAENIVEESGNSETEFHESDSIAVFYDWFVEQYEENEVLEKYIYLNWEGKEPFILKMGIKIIEDLYIENMEDIYRDVMDKKMQTSVDKLIRYIKKYSNVQCVLTFCTEDGNVIIEISPEKIDKEAEVHHIKLAFANVVDAMFNGGCMIFRRIIAEDNQIVNGFLFGNGNIYDIDSVSLKEATEEQPDGTRKIFKENHYGRSGVFKVREF